MKTERLKTIKKPAKAPKPQTIEATLPDRATSFDVSPPSKPKRVYKRKGSALNSALTEPRINTNSFTREVAPATPKQEDFSFGQTGSTFSATQDWRLKTIRKIK